MKLSTAKTSRGREVDGHPYQVDLIGACVGLVGPHQPKEGVFRGLGDRLGGETCC